MKNSELNCKHRNDEFTVISFRNLLTKGKCRVFLVVKYILTLDVTGCNLHGRVFLMIRCKDSVFSSQIKTKYHYSNFNADKICTCVHFDLVSTYLQLPQSYFPCAEVHQ